MKEVMKIILDDEGKGREYNDEYDVVIHCETEEEQKEIIGMISNAFKSRWIPISERLPEPGKYVLLSSEYFPLPSIGRYEEDEEGGGEFYMADDAERCTYGLYVDAWLPLPEPYGEVRMKK